MMKDLEKSDSAIVAEKQANKGQPCLAELVESRDEAKENPGGQSRYHAQSGLACLRRQIKYDKQ
ncbi:MAG: hypothetical protein OXE78_05930 [Gammaproteobacteria bacterium]|nr:hypothetical protein [Gammaproteobacteria bacterium]